MYAEFVCASVINQTDTCSYELYIPKKKAVQPKAWLHKARIQLKSGKYYLEFSVLLI